jgi:hypothetical protein
LLSKHWEEEETLTINEAAIRICGGEPFDKSFVEENELLIRSVRTRIAKHLLNEKGQVELFLKQTGLYGNELIQGMLLPDTPKWYELEKKIIFFSSFFHKNAALLREEVSPSSDVENYEILRDDIEAWLINQEIRSTFFLNDIENSLPPKPAVKAKLSSGSELKELIDSHFPSRPKQRITPQYKETIKYCTEYYEQFLHLPNVDQFLDFLKGHSDTSSGKISEITTPNKTYDEKRLRKSFQKWRKPTSF